MATIETPPNPYANKKHRESPEMRLQAACVLIAWNEFPETRKLLFHVENEDSHGNSIRGAIRKAQGIVRGVSDLILLIPRGRWHGLMIEMKTKDGCQSTYQREWEQIVTAKGYRYEVIRSEVDFRALLTEYLALPQEN